MINGIIGWVLKRKAATILITLLVFLGGIFATTQLKSELLPNIEFPIMSIATVYPGATSEDVTQQVSKPVEQTVSTLPRLKSLRSTSLESFSFVVAEFDFGTDLKAVEQDLTNKLRNVALPNGLNGSPVQPSISSFSFSSQAIVSLTVEAKKGQNSEQLGKWARENALPALTTLSDVGRVEIVGDPVQLLTISFNADELRKRGLTTNSVLQVLQANNLSFPAGSADIAGQSIPIRTAYTFTNVEDVKNLVIPSASGFGSAAPAGGFGGAPGGASPPQGATGQAGQAGAAPTQAAPTKLSDIATVEIKSAQNSGITRTNGKPGIAIQVYKTQTGNTVKVSDGVIKAIADLNTKYPEVNLGIVYDQADQVRVSIESLVKEGALGAVFAVLVIFLFLRSVRSTLVTAVSIPTSVVIALLLLWQQGITLNIMTLGGLAVAIGRVVDDAIVVLENIYRHVSEGDPVPTAVRRGTREVAGAITSSTITTVAVFMPLGFVGGVSGQFFLPFALTVTFALLASLLVSLTIVPVLASLFITRKSVKEEKQNTLLQRIYTPILKWSLAHRALTLLAAFLLFVGSIVAAGAFGIPLAFLPNSGDKLASVTISLPPGSDQASVVNVTEQAEKILSADNRVELYQTTIAGDSAFARSQRAFGGSVGNASMFVRLKGEADLNGAIKELRERLKAIQPKGGSISIAPLGGFSSNTFSLVVQGPNPDAVRKASDDILAKVKDVPNLANVKSDVSAVVPQIQVTPDPTKAATAGLGSTAVVGSQLRNLLQGQTAGTIRFKDGQSVDVLMLLPKPTGGSLDEYIENLKKLPFAGPLTIGDVAKVERVDGTTQTTRINQQLAATISADITVEDTAGVSREALKKANEVTLPAGVTASQSGVGQQQAEAFGALFIAFFAAIALVYIVMVVTFGSLLEPFAILFSLPLAIIGALAALIITQRALGLPSMIGLLMLIGIVVTNAIVLIDLVNQLRERGYTLYDALVEGGRTRVRPIIMTAVATILALIPLASGIGGGGTIISAELGTVVIGGLLTSTLLTLVVVPVIYSLLEGAKNRLTGGKNKHDDEESSEPDETPTESQREPEPVAVIKLNPNQA